MRLKRLTTTANLDEAILYNWIMTLSQQPGFNLTPKQRAFANHYIETGSAPEAALSAYNCSSRNSARVMGYQARHNPKVRAYLQEQVLTETLVNEGVESLRQALKANKMITNKRGEVVDTWPDYGNRIKAATHLLKLIQDLSGE